MSTRTGKKTQRPTCPKFLTCSKQTTQPKVVGKVQVLIYVQKRRDQNQHQSQDQAMKEPPITNTDSQLPHHVSLSLRSLFQKTKCATTPNA